MDSLDVLTLKNRRRGRSSRFLQYRLVPGAKFSQAPTPARFPSSSFLLFSASAKASSSSLTTTQHHLRATTTPTCALHCLVASLLRHDNTLCRLKHFHPSPSLSNQHTNRKHGRRSGGHYRHGRHGKDVREAYCRRWLEVSARCLQSTRIAHTNGKHTLPLPPPPPSLCNDDLSAFGSSMAVGHHLASSWRSVTWRLSMM